MARRINTRFVGILAGCAVGVVGAIFLAQKLLIKPRPDAFVNQAKLYAKDGQWTLAADQWMRAITAAPDDPEWYTQLGIALHEAGRDDADLAGKQRDRAAWEQALQINPNYVGAVKMLLTYWEELARVRPIPENFRQARDRSEQLLGLIGPDDADRQKTDETLQLITIQGYLARDDEDPDRLNAAAKHMTELMAKDTANPEMPFYLAMLYATQAQKLVESSTSPTQPPEATALFQKAVGIMQNAVKAQEAARALAEAKPKDVGKVPSTAMMHYYAAQFYNTAMADHDRSVPQSREYYGQQADLEMDRAVAVVQPTDPHYVDINLYATSLAFVQGNNQKGVSILRALLKQQGNNPTTIVEAEEEKVLQSVPDLRPQAIETLQKALDTGPKTAAINGMRFLDLSALTSLEIDDYVAADSATVKSDLKDKIERNIQQLVGANLNPVRATRLQARMAAVDKDNIRAIQEITKGMAADPQTAQDFELLWQLSVAYDNMGQRAQAEDYLKRTIQRNPTFLQAREKLAADLASDGTEESRQQISEQMTYLRRVAPDDPTVIQLQMVQLDPKNDLDRLKDLYAKLPEKGATPAETSLDLRAKAQMAATSFQDLDEVTRLLTLNLSVDPEPIDAIINLANVQVGNKKRDDAVAMVQKGLAAHPNDPTLEYGLKQLQNASPEELAKLMDDLIQETKDPVKREIALANEAWSAKPPNLAGAEKHYLAAEMNDPSNKEVWAHLFTLYLATHQFDKATPVLKKLSDANADEAHGAQYEFELARGKGDTQRQLEIAKKLVNDLPEFAMSYFCLGQAYQGTQEWRLAADNFETAIQKKGVVYDNNAQDVQKLKEMLEAEIECYSHLNQPDDELRAITAGRKRFPADVYFHMKEIEFDLQTGNYDPAIADLQDLIKNYPNAPQDEYDQMALSLAAAQMQLATAKRKIPDNAAASAAAGAARDTLVAAMGKFPDDLRLYASLADIYRYGGQPDDAEKLLLALDQRPKWKNQPQTQIMLAELYDKIDQPDKADQAYATAWERNGNGVETGAYYARSLMQHKKFDKAMEVVNTELAAVNAVHGDTSDLRRQHYKILVSANRGAEAMTEIKALLAGNPPDAQQLLGILGQLELNAGQTADAGAIAAKLLAVSPRDVRALLLKSRLEMMQSPADASDAQSDLELARQISPDNMEVLFSLADVYLYRFDAKSAGEILAHALRLNPVNTQLRVKLAYMYSTMEPIRLDQALTVIQDGINQPGGDKIPELANALAGTYQQMGNNNMAVKVSVDALTRMPGKLELIRPYLELLLAVGNYKTAADQSTALIQQNQQIWWMWHIRARARAALGDKAGASSDLDQALALVDAAKDSQDAISIIETVDHAVGVDRAIELIQKRPANDAQWNTLLIMLYHDHGDDDQAIKVMEPMLADASATPAERAQRLEMAGVIYATAQPKPFADKSFDAYKQLLAINHDYVPALNNIASLCADSFTPPRIEEGLGYIRHAMDLLNSRGASDPMSEDTYGWLLILGGQTEQGMAVLQKAVDRKSFPEGYYHLGEGYLHMNRPEDARKQVNLALKAVADAQQSGQPVSSTTRAKISDLSDRVLGSLRLRTSGNLP